MAFTKRDIRSILQGAGVPSENITTAMIDEICELHIETQNAVVDEKLKKVDVKGHQDYVDLKSKYDEAVKNGNKDVKVEETQAYKDLQKQFDDFKGEITNKERNQKITDIKKTELEKLGFKGSALNLVLKDDSTIEFDDEGKVKEDSLTKYVEGIKTNYQDLIVVDKGNDGANPNQNPKENNNGSVTKEQFYKMGYQQRVELKQNNPDAYKNLVDGE